MTELVQLTLTIEELSLVALCLSTTSALASDNQSIIALVAGNVAVGYNDDTARTLLDKLNLVASPILGKLK